MTQHVHEGARASPLLFSKVSHLYRDRHAAAVIGYEQSHAVRIV